MPTQRAFDLERFVTAQAPVFATALAELQAGEKRSHWMWFVFPQLRGLGHSVMAMRYGIGTSLPRPPAAWAAADRVHPRRAGDRGPAAARHLWLAVRREVLLLHDLVLARARGE